MVGSFITTTLEYGFAQKDWGREGKHVDDRHEQVYVFLFSVAAFLCASLTMFNQHHLAQLTTLVEYRDFVVHTTAKQACIFVPLPHAALVLGVFKYARTTIPLYETCGDKQGY